MLVQSLFCAIIMTTKEGLYLKCCLADCFIDLAVSCGYLPCVTEYSVVFWWLHGVPLYIILHTDCSVMFSLASHFRSENLSGGGQAI